MSTRKRNERCAIEGCEKPPKGAMCRMHDTRIRRHGTPDSKIHTEAPPAERLLRFFTPGEPEKCWEWNGYISEKGYGKLGTLYAHRVSYEKYIGPIPPAMEVMHSCDNPPCLNPAHLELGTHAQNMADAARKNRVPKRSGYPRGAPGIRAVG